MKKYLPILLCLCLMLTACRKEPSALQETPPPAASAEQSSLPDLDKIKDLLRDTAQLKAQENTVLTDFDTSGGTQNLERIEEFLAHVQNGESDYFVGIIPMEPVITAYAVAYDGAAKACTYLSCIKLQDEYQYQAHPITQINNCGLFWNFTDGREFSFSIPKTNITHTEKDILFDTPPAEELGSVTRQEAVLKAQETAHALEQAVFGSIYGIIAPPASSDGTFPSQGECVGAYRIGDERFYQVRVQSETGVEDFYAVSTENPDRIFWIEQVNGGLVPICPQHPAAEFANT